MNTEMDATPPAGYFLCPACQKTWAGVGLSCWGCRFKTHPSRQFSEAESFARFPDWHPPIAAPKLKVENKTTVDGKCPLCGVAVPSTHIHLCSPQHVERRKGQRWCSESTLGNGPYVVEGTLLGREDFHDLGFGWNLGDAIVNGKPQPDGAYVFYDRNFTKDSRTFTLIADAPAEPGKPTTPQCDPSCRPGLRCKYCTTEVATKAPSAHEVPKAAPVCCGRCGGSIGIRNVPFEQGLIKMCHGCRDNLAAWMSAQTGTPYKGPERLRSVLARDEMVEADWLPEASR